jgi:hypothetical protein
VTLRRDRAYEFLNKLFNAVLPGIRDFRGLSASSFDGRGNYTLGLSEQLAFPEISYKEVTATQGMDITIVTTAQTDKEGGLTTGATCAGDRTRTSVISGFVAFASASSRTRERSLASRSQAGKGRKR